MSNAASLLNESGTASASDRRAMGSTLDQEIYEKIYRAIIEQRLMPGTKLGEESLCEVFDVSRARIRRVLLTLSNRNIVDLHPNRGAFIARPTTREATDIFDARLAIELAIVRGAVEKITKKQAGRLRSHVDEERRAQKRKNRREAITLSGKFHLLLAHIAGNQVLESYLEELVSRTSLIIGMYGAAGSPDCPYTDHLGIVDAIDGGDAEQAVALMSGHLHHIIDGLHLPASDDNEINLAEIFSDL
jgi:DNA-binding GntR family transcriptional regulator